MATKTIKKSVTKKIETTRPVSTKVTLIGITNNIDTFKESLSTGSCFNSCGVVMVDNVNSAYISATSGLTSEKRTRVNSYIEQNLVSLLNSVESKKAFYNISLTKNSNKSLIALLDKVCKNQTDWRKNPNSGNQIKVWMV